MSLDIRDSANFMQFRNVVRRIINFKNCERARRELGENKETTLERADFTLQLLMFVTAEKERRMFVILFISIFCQLLSPRF